MHKSVYLPEACRPGGQVAGHPVVPDVILPDMKLDLIVTRLPGVTFAGFAVVMFTAAIQRGQARAPWSLT